MHVDSANGRQDGASVVVGQHGGWRRVAMLAALESGVGQVRSGRYHRLCAPPSTDFHFPSVTPPRSGSGWRHQPPSLRRFPILNVKRKTSSEFRVHTTAFDHGSALFAFAEGGDELLLRNRIGFVEDLEGRVVVN